LINLQDYTSKSVASICGHSNALSGFFEEALDTYGVTCNVGRGYDGWSSNHIAGERYRDEPNTVTVLGLQA
jgi:hypothetical protein